MIPATTALTQAPSAIARGVSSADLMPLLDIANAVARRKYMVDIIKNEVLVKDVDFGIIPGTPKPTLLKPGAEKLASMFGLAPRFSTEEKIEDWTGAEHGGEPLFYYRYKCVMCRNDYPLGEGEGSGSTWESKYRFRWVPEPPAGVAKESLPKRGGVRNIFEPDFALAKKETTGKFGKAAEYWQRFEDMIAANTAKREVKKKMGTREFDGYTITVDELQYRVSNPDIFDQVNTVLKMAMKRAYVAAVLMATSASEFFTQDLEDMTHDPAGPSDTPHESTEEVTNRRIAEEKARLAAQAGAAAASTAPADTSGSPKPNGSPRGPQPVPPAAASASEPGDAPELADMLQACANRKGIEAAFSTLGDRMVLLYGEEDSQAKFAELMFATKTQSINSLYASVKQARSFIRQWYAHIEAAMEARKPRPEVHADPDPLTVPTAATTAATTPKPAQRNPDVSDDDLPAELFAKSPDAYGGAE